MSARETRSSIGDAEMSIGLLAQEWLAIAAGAQWRAMQLCGRLNPNDFDPMIPSRLNVPIYLTGALAPVIGHDLPQLNDQLRGFGRKAADGSGIRKMNVPADRSQCMLGLRDRAESIIF